jgi:hypothetical protein
MLRSEKKQSTSAGYQQDSAYDYEREIASHILDSYDSTEGAH